MVLKIFDLNSVPALVSLDDNEMIEWRQEFGAIRKREMLVPSAYIDMAVTKLGGVAALASRAHETTQLILDIRETAWQLYIEHEQVVSGQAMMQLLQNNTEAHSVVDAIIKRDGVESFSNISEDDLSQKLAAVIGEVSGRVFPYLYELAKSITQSRRSRAGTAFEKIIRYVIDAKGFPCDDQSKAGTQMFESLGLGKIVDGLIPGIAGYNENRTKCAVITMKTTLRERWQEVVEELERTKIPNVYLLTLDDKLNKSSLATMRNHNITVVAPRYVQEANPAEKNLISFETLFNEELPHLLKYWEK